MRLLSQRIKEPALRALCQGLWERLSEGLPLSRAMEEFPHVFDSSTVNLIQAGEATGGLNEVVQRLIQHFTEQRELRQKLVTAMAYPAFICVFAVGVIIFFFFVLLPKLQSLLTALGGKLPLVTRLLIDASHLFINYGLFAILALVLAAVSFWRWRQTEPGRVLTDEWVLRLPFAASFVTTATVMNFTQTLAVLIENGITTAEALRMTERVIANRTHRQAFAEATARVLEGESLSLALARTGCFPRSGARPPDRRGEHRQRGAQPQGDRPHLPEGPEPPPAGLHQRRVDRRAPLRLQLRRLPRLRDLLGGVLAQREFQVLRPGRVARLRRDLGAQAGSRHFWPLWRHSAMPPYNAQTRTVVGRGRLGSP